MTTASLHRVAVHLRQVVSRPEQDRQSDTDLLDRFRSSHDQCAFEALLRRHGPMVLGVCRRLLGDEHADDDAFQATFLVLLRRASIITPGSNLGPWLYGVARRTALKARTSSARRRRAEQEAGRRRPDATCSANRGCELRWLIDEEMGHLPEKYRGPLVLCLLQGKSRKEAARLLGWSEGTLSGRLARARQMLGHCLRRRGVESDPVEGISPAPLSAVLLQQTFEAAVSAIGYSAAPCFCPGVIARATEVVKSMLTWKLTTLAAVVGIGLGTAALAWQPGPGTPKADSGSKRAAVPARPRPKVPPYVIEPPDILFVQYGAASDTGPVRIKGPFLVRPDGTVGLGPLGSVNVTGLTVEQARDSFIEHLKGRLDGFDAGKLVVQLETCNSKFVYVVTRDARKGEQVYRFPLTEGKTVLDVLVQINDAKHFIGIGKKSICVRRSPPRGLNKQLLLPVDWQAITQNGNVATNYPLQAGDRVYIQPREQHRTPILAANTDVGQLPPPSEADVIRALSGKKWAKAEGIQIVFERGATRIDPSRFYPLVGPARLARVNWTCTVYGGPKTETVHVDVECLILSR